MSLTIHLTQDWPIERLARYGPELTAAMNKLVARFPDDLSVKKIADQLIAGEQQLWLILDENEKFHAFATSEITTSETTGRKRVMLCELAGEGGTDLVAMIEPFEAWARKIGADEVCFVGRTGWRKAFSKHGYEPVVMRFRKELNHGRKLK